LQTSKAIAWLSERDYVTPDDLKAVALPLLRHRLILKPEAQLDGVQMDAVVASILKQVAVPR
jgi:MoxR-like ATPase